MAQDEPEFKREDYTVQKTRGGDEWEIIANQGKHVVATGFDDEEEAEGWLKDELISLN